MHFHTCIHTYIHTQQRDARKASSERRKQKYGVEEEKKGPDGLTDSQRYDLVHAYCMHACMCACIHTCMHARRGECTVQYMIMMQEFVSMCVCVCLCICLSVCIYIYTHTQIYIFTLIRTPYTHSRYQLWKTFAHIKHVRMCICLYVYLT